MANSIDRGCPDLDAGGLENLLLWLLKADLETHFDGTEGPFGKSIDEISKWICQFFKKGYGEATLLGLATKLRNTAYQFGTPRQLLFGDVIAAVLKKARKLCMAGFTVIFRVVSRQMAPCTSKGFVHQGTLARATSYG